MGDALYLCHIIFICNMLKLNSLKLIKKYSAYVYNKYFITALVFVIWVTFFDRNNLVVVSQLQDVINELEDEGRWYDDKLSHIQDNLDSIKEDRERYARETYYLHKKNEIVFVVK